MIIEFENSFLTKSNVSLLSPSPYVSRFLDSIDLFPMREIYFEIFLLRVEFALILLNNADELCPEFVDNKSL